MCIFIKILVTAFFPSSFASLKLKEILLSFPTSNSDIHFLWSGVQLRHSLFVYALISIGFGNRYWEKSSFRELGDNENEAVVKTNKSATDPRDQLGHRFCPPGQTLMSPVSRFHLLRAILQFPTTMLSSPYSSVVSLYIIYKVVGLIWGSLGLGKLCKCK